MALNALVDAFCHNQKCGTERVNLVTVRFGDLLQRQGFAQIK